MTYTYDHPIRTYDGEWSTTYDGNLDRGTLDSDTVTGTVGLATSVASAGLDDVTSQVSLASTTSATETLDDTTNQTEVADVDL